MRDAIEIPMALPSLANSRGHTRAKARTVAKQRKTVAVALRALQLGPLRSVPLCDVPLTIELVRVAPRRLDCDNLQGAMKPTRDAVTKWLGYADDAHPRLRWLYGQATDGRARYQAARVTVVLGHHDCDACGSALLGATVGGALGSRR